MCDRQQREIDPLAQVICISTAYCLVDTNLGFIQACLTGKILVGIILKIVCIIQQVQITEHKSRASVMAEVFGLTAETGA